MGSWNETPFGNDDAIMLLQSIGESGRSVVKDVLKRIVEFPENTYIQMDDGCSCWAACELVALSLGNDDMSAYNFEIIDATREVRKISNIQSLALRAINRVLDQDYSELIGELKNTQLGFQRISELPQRLLLSKKRLIYRLPKRGDVYFIPSYIEKENFLVVQVLGNIEIVVFEGRHRLDADAAEIIENGRSNRVIADTGDLLRSAKQIENKPLKNVYKSEKKYSSRLGNPFLYFEDSAKMHSRQAEYDEIKTFPEFKYYSVSMIDELAENITNFDSIISPEEWERQIQQENKEKWERRRAITSPGPFGDIQVIVQLKKYIKEFGLANALINFIHRAGKSLGYGRPDENAERQDYCLIGLIAIWKEILAKDCWPFAEVGDIPELTVESISFSNNFYLNRLFNTVIEYTPEELIKKSVIAAKELIAHVLEPGSELRFIWFNTEENKAEITSWVSRLQIGLEQCNECI